MALHIENGDTDGNFNVDRQLTALKPRFGLQQLALIPEFGIAREVSTVDLIFNGNGTVDSGHGTVLQTCDGGNIG